MNKEVNTFHSGRYLFSAEITTDLSVINDALNVFSKMPIFPDTIKDIKDNALENAIFSEAALEESTVTIDQVSQIIKHNRANFSQDTKAVETINIYMAHKLISDKKLEEITPDLISDIHRELITALPNIKDSEGNYRKGGAKADEKWLSVSYTPPASTLDVNFLVKNLLEWIINDLKDLNPIIRSILLHLHLKKIQPYNNANGSTARLVETFFLRHNKVKLLPYILPVIYNDNREEYYKCISEFYYSSDITPIIKLISSKLLCVVNEVRDKNFKIMEGITSSHYLTKLYQDKILIKRQYDFLCMLKDGDLTFTQEDLQLKKPFTKLYGKVSRTTVSRDIKKYDELDLIRSSQGGYSFNHDMLDL